VEKQWHALGGYFYRFCGGVIADVLSVAESWKVWMLLLVLLVGVAVLDR